MAAFALVGRDAEEAEEESEEEESEEESEEHSVSETTVIWALCFGVVFLELDFEVELELDGLVLPVSIVVRSDGGWIDGRSRRNGSLK